MKKKTIGLLCATLALSVCFCVGTTISANATTEAPTYVQDGVAVEGFYVQDGAAVHLATNTTGIKYTTIVTKAFQDYLTKAYEGATFEWHTLITGTNMLDDGDVTSVTPDLTKPDWVGENAGEAACENFTQTLKDMVDNTETGEIADVDKDGATDQKYAAAITYEALTGDEKTAASNAELIARSYVKITQGETETIVYAAADDTVRNMKGVAYEAIQSGKYTASEDNLYGYTGVTSADVVYNEEVGGFYSEKDNSGAIIVNGLTATDCDVYYGAKKVAASVQDGVVTVSGIDGLTVGEGKEYELTVFGGGKIYNQTFGCATLVIDEAKDLDVFCLDITDYSNYSDGLNEAQTAVDPTKMVKKIPTVTGYYVLGKNIDATEYAMKTQGYISNTGTSMDGYGFKGTFDGRGYTINGITFGDNTLFTKDTIGNNKDTRALFWNQNNYSLFGVIGNGGTVKNFALTNVNFDLSNTQVGNGGTINLASCAPIAKWIRIGATVENVYVSVKGVKGNYYGNDTGAGTCVSGFAYCVDTHNYKTDGTLANEGAKLENIFVDATFETTGDYKNVLGDNSETGSFVYRKYAQVTKTDNSWKNIVVISNVALADECEANEYDASNITLEDGSSYVNMPNTYRYESVGAWEAAEEDTAVTTKPDVSTFGTAYWHLVNGVPVWGKATA